MVTTELSQLTAADWLKDLQPDMEKVLPKLFPAERMARLVLTQFRKIPKLMQCSKDSVAGSILTVAQLGLEVGSALGQAWILPFAGEAVLVIGYRGMFELAYRSRLMARIDAQLVCEKDFFEQTWGTEVKIIHRPALRNRGDIIGAYAIGQLKGGLPIPVWMDIDELESIRKRSPAVRSGKKTPYDTDYGEMMRRIPAKRLWKYLPSAVMPPVAWDTMHKEDQVFYETTAERVAERTEATAADLRKRLEQSKAGGEGEADPAEPSSVPADATEPSASNDKPGWQDDYEKAGDGGELPF